MYNEFDPKHYKGKWPCTTKTLYNEKTLIGRLHQYFLIYFETFSVPTADTLFLLILSILTLCYNLSSASPPWIFLLFWCYHLTINGCAKIPTTNWFYGGDNWVLWQIKRWLKAFNCQLNYEEFQNHVADLEASIHATDNKIQQTRLAIQNQQVIQKHCEVYRPVVTSYVLRIWYSQTSVGWKTAATTDGTGRRTVLSQKKAGSPEATEYPAYNWKKFWCYDPQSWYQGSGESAFTKNLELLNAKKEKLK